MSSDESKPRASVIEGSLGGLCAGVLHASSRLAREHLRAFTGTYDDRGAGIVLQSEMRRFESPQMKMELHLRDYGISAGNQIAVSPSAFDLAAYGLQQNVPAAYGFQKVSTVQNSAYLSLSL